MTATFKTATNKLRQMAIDGANLCDQYGFPSDWYAHARQQMAIYSDLVAPYLPTEYVSGIVAITSANCTVRENFKRATQYLTQGHLGNVKYLAKICDEHTLNYGTTGDPNILGSKRLNGVLQYTDKTNEFRQNICPVHGDDNRITVDRHIFDAVGGNTAKHRELAIVAIMKVAQSLGMSPSEAQACIWYCVKWDKGHRSVGAPSHLCPFSPFGIADWYCDEVLTCAA